MGQLNIHMTPAFENALAEFMRARGIKTKSEAIRVAVQEGLAHLTRKVRVTDFSDWLGVGRRAPLNPHPRFSSDRDLWG